MGQIISIDSIISMIEVKSSPDMNIYPIFDEEKITQNTINYEMKIILNVELNEEQIV